MGSGSSLGPPAPGGLSLLPSGGHRSGGVCHRGSLQGPHCPQWRQGKSLNRTWGAGSGMALNSPSQGDHGRCSLDMSPSSRFPASVWSHWGSLGKGEGPAPCIPLRVRFQGPSARVYPLSQEVEPPKGIDSPAVLSQPRAH